MKINSSLAKLLADELKNTTRQKPLPWSLFMKKYVETRQYTEAQLVAAMNTLVLPHGNVSGNTVGFWVGLPES